MSATHPNSASRGSRDWTPLTYVAVALWALTASLGPSRSVQGNPEGQTPSTAGVVIEVVTFMLKDGVSAETFRPLDDAVATQHVSKQPGFLARQSAASADGQWLVIVHWRSIEDADASMATFATAPATKQFMASIKAETMNMKRYVANAALPGRPTLGAPMSNKRKAVALLESLETRDSGPVAYINPNKYIQHNLAVADGLEGFGALLKTAPPEGFKAKVVRAFEDGDFVVAHTLYDFFGPKAGFDVFRFEDGLIVEHWDNLTAVQPPNPSGRTQTDGPTEVTDLDKTEANKRLVKSFVDEVLIGGKTDNLTTFINPEKYHQHNPAIADGLDGLGAALKYFADNGLVMKYTKTHKVLGQGNFVLTMSEGQFGKGDHTAFYDLFRVEDGRIVEHWDVISTIPPRSEWKNDNGKF